MHDTTVPWGICPYKQYKKMMVVWSVDCHTQFCQTKLHVCYNAKGCFTIDVVSVLMHHWNFALYALKANVHVWQLANCQRGVGQYVIALYMYHVTIQLINCILEPHFQLCSLVACLGSGWEQLLFITIDQSVGLLWPIPQFDTSCT